MYNVYQKLKNTDGTFPNQNNQLCRPYYRRGQIRCSLHSTFQQRIFLATSTMQNTESVFQHRCAQQYYTERSCSFSFHTNRRAEQGKEKVQAVLLFPRVEAVFIQVCEFSYDDTNGHRYTVRFKTGLRERKMYLTQGII